MSSSVHPRADVVVVGAGLAGLAAAVSLHQAGLDVCVLEARERPGGRVRTLRTFFDDGLFAEAGATFISAGHTTLRRYLTAYGLTYLPRPPLARTLLFGGRSSLAADLHKFGGGAAADTVRVQFAATRLSASVPEPDCAWRGTISAGTARQAGVWRYSYARQGTPLSTADTLPAAVALEQAAVLITGNVKVYPMPEFQMLALTR